MISQKTIEIIKSTVPVLEVHGESITRRFYQLLFESHPELLNIFNQVNQKKGRQQTALANAVYAAAVHIDQLESILPAVKQIAHKHRGLGIKPEQYPIVGQNLLAAIKDVLGDAATYEIIDAWAIAYGVIADAFISVEADMYQTAKSQSGGWDGFRSFVVKRKVQESDVITSFYLVPQDDGAIASFEPGQYLTVKVDIPGQEYTQRRQYSLSDTPGKPYYRISVKREDPHDGLPAGLVSSYLHTQVTEGDVIEVSAPAGDFVLQDIADRPIVFLSGGVGLTPLTSMLGTLLERNPEADVTYIHAALNGRVHALREEFAGHAQSHGTLKLKVVYETPDEADASYIYFAKDGYITLDWLKTVVSQDSEFYFCGPIPFMRAIYQSLKTWGVDNERIHYEFFGPQGSLEA